MRQLVGHVSVDAGCVMVGDPCYTLPDEGSSRTDDVRDWRKFCDRMFDEKNKLAEGVVAPFDWREAGLVVDSGYGDGTYPVYVDYVPDDLFPHLKGKPRVARLVVEFISDEKEDEFDDQC